VSKAKGVLIAISNAVVCEGNCDERFLVLPNIHENTMKDATRMFIVVHYCNMMLLLDMNLHAWNCNYDIQSFVLFCFVI